jgi:serine/threonine-protein kinase
VDHANVLRIKSYDVAADEVLVIGDLIDGEMLAQICAHASGRIPLELTLRILVDVLAGLTALHEATDSTGRLLKLVHGQLAREEIFVGLDGVARITNVAKTSVRRDARYVGYLAPEVLLAEETPDARADVYSVGVHLWEALANKRLFDGGNVGEVLSQQVNSPIPRPEISQDTLWAVPLVEVALKALSPDRKKRYASAAEMRDDIVRAAGAGKLADAAAVGALVETLVGKQIRERRRQLSVPLARSPSSSAVRRQGARARAADGDDDPTVAEVREDKDSDSGEIPTEVLTSATIRKLQAGEKDGADDDERTIDSRAPGAIRAASELEDDFKTVQKKPPGDTDEDVKTLTTNAVPVAERTSEKPGADYEDGSITRHTPRAALQAAEKLGADYQDDSVTREAPTKARRRSAAAPAPEHAYLEESATKKKILEAQARSNARAIARSPAAAADAAVARASADAVALVDVATEDDVEDDDSITSQAPAAVTKLLRMVAAEVSEARQKREGPRPAAGMPPANASHVVQLASPTGPMPEHGSPPSISPIRATHAQDQLAGQAPQHVITVAPHAMPHAPVLREDAFAKTVNAQLEPFPPDSPQAQPQAQPQLGPPSGPRGAPFVSDVDVSPPRTPKKHVVIVVGIFVASALFCVVMALKSFGRTDDAPVVQEPPRTEEPVRESLTDSPFASRGKAAPKGPASTTKGPLKPPPKRR